MGYILSASVNRAHLEFIEKNFISPSILVQEALNRLMATDKTSIEQYIKNLEHNIAKMQSKLILQDTPI